MGRLVANGPVSRPSWWGGESYLECWDLVAAVRSVDSAARLRCHPAHRPGRAEHRDVRLFAQCDHSCSDQTRWVNCLSWSFHIDQTLTQVFSKYLVWDKEDKLCTHIAQLIPSMSATGPGSSQHTHLHCLTHAPLRQAKGRLPKKNTSYSVTLSLLP